MPQTDLPDGRKEWTIFIRAGTWEEIQTVIWAAQEKAIELGGVEIIE